MEFTRESSSRREALVGFVMQRLGQQLQAMGLPTKLHRIACEKVIYQIFDLGSVVLFQFHENNGDNEECEDDECEDNSKEEPTKLSESEDNWDICAHLVNRKYDLVASKSMSAGSDVYLIDHMWTTNFPQSREHLRKLPTLISRVASLFNLPAEIETTVAGGGELDQAVVDALWDKMWPLLNSYNIDGPDGYTTWYMMDEVGSALSHNRMPNCRVYPLYVNLEGIDGIDLPSGMTFGLSLLWPVSDIEEGDVLTRDYLPSSYSTNLIGDKLSFDADLKHRIEQICENIADPELRKIQINLELMRELKQIGYFDVPISLLACSSSSSTSSVVVPDDAESYFRSIERICESVMNQLEVNAYGSGEAAHGPLRQDPPSAWELICSKLASAAEAYGSGDAVGFTKLKIFCDRPDYLSSEHLVEMSNYFQFVSNSSDADILYLIDHVIDVETDEEHLKTNKVLTQFWWEGMVVTKNHFIRTMKASWAKANQGARSVQNSLFCWPWIAPTYDLSKARELCHFLQHFTTLKREISLPNGRFDNLWLLKKYTGRQGIDYPITDNISCALRHTDLWPRLACKYIAQPCLFHGCKFDLRYYVVVLSLKPLKIMRHKIFIPRASNVSYSLDDFECYQKHFTVMGFLEEKTILQDIRGEGFRKDPLMNEFIAEFDQEQSQRVENSELRWDQHIQPAIDNVLRSIFENVSAVAEDEPAHPSAQALHANAGWSIKCPNECPARAMFGVDIMLDSGATAIITDSVRIPQPVVLEVQFAPDCSRTFQTYPQFWDLSLAALFLNSSLGMVSL